MNKQLYNNSCLNELFEASKDPSVPRPEGLFNAKEPNLAILHEKPEHRVILWMKARGTSNTEIAKQTGYTDAWISQLVRQPWFQDKLLREIEDAGRDEISTLLEGAAADSVIKLIEIRDTSKNVGVSRQACVDLLDRFLGKPVQQVKTEVTAVAAQTVEELDAEINRLQEQEKSLLHRN